MCILKSLALRIRGDNGARARRCPRYGPGGLDKREHLFVASHGSAHGRSLEDALGYVGLLAELKPEKLERAAVRWHGRLETEAPFLTLAESQLALVALASLCAGEREALEILRRLLRRVRPTAVSSMD